MPERQETTRKRRRFPDLVLQPASALALALAPAGCAFSYVDSSNVRHIIGFVDVALPAAPAEAASPTPSVVSVTSLGVHVYSGTANGSGLVVGYGKETVVVMPNNACIDLGAPGLCAAAAVAPAQTANGKAAR